jgi:predicted metal-dependent hydrolase
VPTGAVLAAAAEARRMTGLVARLADAERALADYAREYRGQRLDRARVYELAAAVVAADAASRKSRRRRARRAAS